MTSNRRRPTLGMVLSLWVATIAGRAAAESPFPLGLPPLPRIEGETPKASKIELGKQLFFDSRLSRDETVRCASCHDPGKGWTDGKPVATGIEGKVGTRSAPTVVNAGYLRQFFWDGRADSLEEQVCGSIENPLEMGMPMAELADRLNQIEGYGSQFQEVFGQEATRESISGAIAAFVRTLVGGNSAYDRYRAGDLDALSPAARRGHDVFTFRANCTMCHRGPLLTDGDFHNLGAGMDAEEPDPGRAAVSGDMINDTGAFRTPSLRDISRTGPYMHNGQFTTLEDVVDFYERGGLLNPHRMPMLNIVPFTEQDKQDLVTFLKEGLTSDDYPEVSPPTLPD